MKKQKKGPDLITEADYARRVGVSRQRINKLIQKGKIPKIDGMIDPDKADKALKDNLDPAQSRKSSIGIGVDTSDRSSGKSPYTFSELRTIKEGYAAELLQLTIQEKKGKLVNKYETETAYVEKVGNVIRRLQKIPKMIAPALAKETSPFECEGIAMNAIKKAVTEF